MIFSHRATIFLKTTEKDIIEKKRFFKNISQNEKSVEVKSQHPPGHFSLNELKRQQNGGFHSPRNLG